MADSRLALHAQGKVYIDEVFDAVAAVGMAKAKHGRENVVDATIGSLCDENENLVFLPTVEKVFRGLNNDDIAAYSDAKGLPEYLSAAINQTFGGNKPEAYIAAVSTPGGSGAVHNLIWNYADIGESVLTHDWYWQPYNVLCSDSLHRLETFRFLDEQLQFNIKAFELKVCELLTKQDKLVIVLNTPNHNPTGYSLTDNEWDQVLQTINQCAQKNKAITLLVDAAYIDYLAEPDKGRAFMRKFSRINQNVFVALAFSMSKGFTLYGQRMGALIGVSKDKHAIEEFLNAATITCRSRWSNLSRAAMKTLIEIYREQTLLDQVGRERYQYVSMMRQRAEIFMQEANSSNLKILPYCGGFFITVPAEDPVAVSNILQQSNVYVVPVANGIRIAVCAVPAKKIYGFAGKIAEAFAEIRA